MKLKIHQILEAAYSWILLIPLPVLISNAKVSLRARFVANMMACNFLSRMWRREGK